MNEFTAELDPKAKKEIRGIKNLVAGGNTVSLWGRTTLPTGQNGS